MKLKYKIQVSGVNSCGTEFNIDLEGTGDNLDLTIAKWKVSNKIWELVHEELSASIAEFQSKLDQ